MAELSLVERADELSSNGRYKEANDLYCQAISAAYPKPGVGEARPIDDRFIQLWTHTIENAIRAAELIAFVENSADTVYEEPGKRYLSIRKSYFMARRFLYETRENLVIHAHLLNYSGLLSLVAEGTNRLVGYAQAFMENAHNIEGQAACELTKGRAKLFRGAYGGIGEGAEKDPIKEYKAALDHFYRVAELLRGPSMPLVVAYGNIIRLEERLGVEGRDVEPIRSQRKALAAHPIVYLQQQVAKDPKAAGKAIADVEQILESLKQLDYITDVDFRGEVPPTQAKQEIMDYMNGSPQVVGDKGVWFDAVEIADIFGLSIHESQEHLDALVEEGALR